MTEGPVPAGEGAADNDAMTAQRTVAEVEPDWLDNDLPPDWDGGDERDWPGETADVAAQAEADGTHAAEVTARLIATGIETAVAHVPGAPPVPGIKTGPGGGFGQSEPLDTAPPEPALAMQADYASGAARRFGGVSDDELCGLLGARHRLESRQAWEKLMAVAEFIRRRPAPGCKLQGQGLMPRVWAEGTAAELSVQFAITHRAAEGLLSLAWDLAVKLPLSSAMLRDGLTDLDKTTIIASYCANLTPEEAGQAEQILFATPDIARKTRSMIRDRIARAVIEVNPDAARKRRESAAKERRIEIRPEVSGNSMVAGRELPPAAVLALDQKLTARARQLKKLGVPGDMDELRVLAFLERWGEADPVGDLARASQADDGDTGDSGTGSGDDPGPGQRPSGPGPASPADGACPVCGQTRGAVATQVHLIAPLATLTGNAGRPGILRGAGPIDPDMVRGLADAAAKSPKTTYQFTLTDPYGRPVAHARGTPGPDDPARGRKLGRPDPPASTSPAVPTLTLIDHGLPGRYGNWRYTHGSREIIFGFENLDGECDHRHQAPDHDPSALLRRLTGVLNQECTFPTCRTPQHQADYEHSRPTDQGGITCLCSCGPVCRRNHRIKQQKGWKITGTGRPGWFRWTLPSGRTYLTGPTEYPI